MNPAVQHATLRFERHIADAPKVVFAAYSDVQQRVRWGVPSDAAVLIYDAAEFRHGGTDRFRCGPKNDPSINGTTHYLSIAAEQHIVSSETLDRNGQQLAAALTTVEFRPKATGTELVVTVQIASFIGEGMIEGYEQGHRASLDSLARFLTHS